MSVSACKMGEDKGGDEGGIETAEPAASKWQALLFARG